MKNSKTKKIIFILALFLLVISSFSAGKAYAAVASTDYTLLEPVPCIAGTGNNCTPGQTITTLNFTTFVEYVYKFAIALAVFLAIVMIIWGGFKYMFTESFTDKSAAKNTIKNAVIGLLVAIGSYLILLTIDPRLVEINSALPPICPPGMNTGLCAPQASSTPSLSTTTRAATNQSIAQVNSLQQDIQNQQAIIDQEEGYKEDPDYVPTEQNQAAELSAQVQIQHDLSQQAQITSIGAGAAQLTTVLSTIDDTSNWNTQFLSPTGTITTADANAKEQIDLAFADYLETVENAGDTAGIQEMDNAQTFLKGQIDTETSFKSALIDASYISDPAKKAAALSALQTQYASPAPANIASDPLLLPVYNNIISSRVANINKTAQGAK